MKSFHSKKMRSNITPYTENVLKEIPTIKPFQYKLLPDRFPYPWEKSSGDK